MTLPEIEIERVRRWCATRVPPDETDQLRVDCDVADRDLTIVEVRPPWDGVGEHTRVPIARLKYVSARKEWSLLWCDSNDRFHAYDNLPAAPTTERLLEELDRDPHLLGLSRTQFCRTPVLASCHDATLIADG